MQVVIIDDHEVNVTLFRHLIQRLPECEAICFTSSTEALSWCDAQQPDLIVVDYMMPELDGVSFIKRFRSSPNHADTPVLMVTANSDSAVRYEALQVGATDFLTKPVDRTEFTARVKNMLALRRHQKALADRAAWLAEEVEKATQHIRESEHEAIFRLCKAAEYRDPETGAHIQRMAHFSRLIAEELGLARDQQALLLAAAPMHDVGKVGIPDQILLKPGRLDDGEMAIMRTHTQIGYEILKDSESELMQMAATIALSHHEKFDGTGYPNGLKADHIPLIGRIVAVADVFDALTSERPYKKAWPDEQATQFLKEQRGLHFDPECLDAFFERWDDIQEIRSRYHG